MSLKARYKLNGNVEEIGGTISGNINTECMDLKYSKEIYNTLTNIDVFTNSNYIVTFQSGYIYVYDQDGNSVWNNRYDNTNSFGVDIKQKHYDNILSIKVNKNTIAIVYYSMTVSTNKYNVYCDAYNIFGRLIVDNKMIGEEIDEKPNVSIYMSENSIYALTDNKNNNYIKLVSKINDEVDYNGITLDIESTIKKPYYIRDFKYIDGYWYSLIESNNKFYIQKNYQSGSYHGDFVQLKKSNRNIAVTINEIINTDKNLVFISNNLLYTVDKETLSDITINKTFDNNIKVIKVNERTNKICAVVEHEYLPEGVTESYYINTDVYVMDYNLNFDSANQTKYNVSAITIDNDNCIYVNSGNNLTKYKTAISFVDEGVIADKCVKFNGGDSRIEIDNPFFDKTKDEPINLSESGFSVSLWYKANTFDWSQQVLLGGIVLPEWQDLQYCSYWNKFFMIAENINMLAVGGYDVDNKNFVWRAYNIVGLEYNISSFVWIEQIRRFVAIGKKSNQYYVSENGLDWTTYKLDDGIRLNKIKYIKDKRLVYLIGDNYLGYSDNFYSEPGKITTVENVPNYNLIDIEYNNGVYALISDKTNNIFISTDNLNTFTTQSITSNYEYINLSVGYYKTEKVIMATPESGQYVYILQSENNNRFTSLKLPLRYDEIKNVKVINDKFYIFVNDTYCLTFNDDGSWNTDTTFGNSIAHDINEGIIYTDYDYDSELNIVWKTPIKYNIAVIHESSFVLCKDENTTDFYKVYFVNAKKLNIFENFNGTWESYSNKLSETWKTLMLHDKSANVVTDFSIVIGYNRHLYIVYDNQKFKSDFVFDGSKLDNWYNIVVVADGVNYKFKLYVNDELYNEFEYEPNGNLKIISETLTLGDINKHTGSIRRAELWVDFVNMWKYNDYVGKSWETLGRNSFWDYNYYNTYGCMNDLRFYDHKLTTDEIHEINKINVGTYIGEINNESYPTDTSEFSNDLSTDNLFCINKDWSISFKYKNNAVINNIVFNKGDDEGGIIFGYFDPNIETTKTIWSNVKKIYDKIIDSWIDVKVSQPLVTSDSSLYLLIYDKRNNKDFRKVDFGSIISEYIKGNTKYNYSSGGDVKALDTETSEYDNVIYKYNTFNPNEKHKYGFSYNHKDRMVKLYFDGELCDRLFNLEFNNSDLKFSFNEEKRLYNLYDLKIFHSCLSETEMKKL